MCVCAARMCRRVWILLYGMQRNLQQYVFCVSWCNEWVTVVGYTAVITIWWCWYCEECWSFVDRYCSSCRMYVICFWRQTPYHGSITSDISNFQLIICVVYFAVSLEWLCTELHLSSGMQCVESSYHAIHCIRSKHLLQNISRKRFLDNHLLLQHWLSCWICSTVLCQQRVSVQLSLRCVLYGYCLIENCWILLKYLQSKNE